MPTPVHTDIAIFGAGIAGLWTAMHLRGLGFGVVLLEPNAVGHGQSVASQGIIHGGIKYVLGGDATRSSRLIAPMPDLWRACLDGDGEIDLSGVTILSQVQHLWTTGGFAARLTAAAASAALRSEVETLAANACEGAFTNAPASLRIHRVMEQVLDPQSLLAAFRAHLESNLVRFDSLRAIHEPDGDGLCHIDLDAADERIDLRASRVVLCAGAANTDLLSRAGIEESQVMQTRPLHMVMLRGDLEDLYGHCLRAGSDKPRLTVTTSCDRQGRTVWYVGGLVAETGVERDVGEQIEHTRDEFRAVLPWVNLDDTQWSTLRIDRAEGRNTDGTRPDEPVVRSFGHVHAAWPTKLAFAPLAAQRIEEALDMMPSGDHDAMAMVPDHFSRPEVASLPWDEEDRPWI